MRRAAVFSILLLLVLAVPAGAWVESAAYDVPDGRIATCMHAAGPGRVSLFQRARARPTTDLLSLGARSIEPGPVTAIGNRVSCIEVAGADGTAPLLAGWERIRGGRWSDLALHVASPGDAPETVRTVHGRSVSALAIAVAPGGAAAIAWGERREPDGQHERLFAAVRPSAGAAFGPPTPLGRLGGIGSPVEVGIDVAGRATVAWLQESRSHQLGSTSLLEVASATADGRFGPARRLGRSLGNRVALAVTADGRTLLAADLRGDLAAYERLPGGTRLARVPLHSAGSSSDGLAVALAPDGGAVIAYRNDERSVFAATRPPGAAFGSWDTVVPLARSSGDSLTVFGDDTTAPEDEAGRELQAALGPDGEVALSWVDDTRGHLSATAYSAHGTLTGGMERPQRLGSPCRPAAAAAPVALPDGRLAVAWIDNVRATSIAGWTVARGGGRVHVARSEPAGGDRSPAAPAPRLTARLAGPRALAPGGQLRVHVGCAAACDVRVLARVRSAPGADRGFGGDDEGGAIWAAASATLRAGGAAEVRPPRFYGFNPAGVHGRPRPPIEVIACTPAGPVAERMRLAPPQIAEPPPLPRVIGLAATRRGGAIRITWRTAAPAVGARFYVSTTPGYRRVWRSVHGRGRSSFTVVLRPGRRLVRRVEVNLIAPSLSFPLSTGVRVVGPDASPPHSP